MDKAHNTRIQSYIYMYITIRFVEIDLFKQIYLPLGDLCYLGSNHFFKINIIVLFLFRERN